MASGTANFNRNPDISVDTQIHFAERWQDATLNVSKIVEKAREDARKQREAQKESEKLSAQLQNLLANIPADTEPSKMGHIRKMLQDASTNSSLSDQERETAATLLKQTSPPKLGEFLHKELSAADWERMREITQKYPNAGPIPENNRERVLAWMANYTGKHSGAPYIGSPTSLPKASPEDIQFLNDIRAWLNERQTEQTSIDWTQLNPQIKTTLTAHYDSLKPSTDTDDDSLRSIGLQIALQQYTSAMSGATNAAKTIHDAKKGILEKL